MTIQNAVIDMKSEDLVRVFAVGDIHGCYQELVHLEQKIQVQVSRKRHEGYRIISVGDLIDRGPNAKEVLEHFARGKVAGTHQLVLGNHETFLLLAFWGLRKDLVEKAGITPSWFHKLLFQFFRLQTSNMHSWRQNGGHIVFDSYDASIDDPNTWDKIPPSHLALIFQAPLVVRTPKTVISHALMEMGDLELLESADRGIAVKDELIQAAVVRCLWERKHPALRIFPERRHISGHTPLPQVERNHQTGTIRIDTGAVYGGTLTALDLNTLRTMQVKSKFSCRRGVGS